MLETIAISTFCASLISSLSIWILVKLKIRLYKIIDIVRVLLYTVFLTVAIWMEKKHAVIYCICATNIANAVHHLIILFIEKKLETEEKARMLLGIPLNRIAENKKRTLLISTLIYTALIIFSVIVFFIV